MAYEAELSPTFERQLKKIKKDNVMLQRISKKMSEILENPNHYKPLRNVLKGKSRVQIGSFVMIFEVVGEKVIFHTIDHHDCVY